MFRVAVATFGLLMALPMLPAGAQGYHYNHNAETYMGTGLRLGRAMAELLENKK